MEHKADVVWTPTIKHNCEFRGRQVDDIYIKHTVASCVECGKYWYLGFSMRFSERTDWKPLRWYNFRLRAKV